MAFRISWVACLMVSGLVQAKWESRLDPNSKVQPLPKQFKVAPWVQKAEGLVYDLKALKKSDDRSKVEPVSRLKYFEMKKGDLFGTRNSYLEVDGSGLIAEETVFERNGRFAYYYTYQGQGDVHGWVQAQAEKILFRLTRDGKETKRGKEDFGQKTVVIAPPQVFDLTIRQWDRVYRGDDIRFRVAIPHEAGSFGFKLEKDHHDPTAKRFIMALKPQSFFLRMFVTPFKFHFDTTKNALSKVVGRVPVRRPGKKLGKWEDMDAEVRMLRMDRKIQPSQSKSAVSSI